MSNDREPLDILTRLSPGERYVHRRKWSHAEAGMLLAGLRCEQVWMAYAKYLQDEPSERLLTAWLYQHAAGIAAEEGWKIERGVPRIKRLAEIAVWTFLRGNEGRSERELAAMLGVNQSTWHRTWARRYRGLRDVIENRADELQTRLIALR